MVNIFKYWFVAIRYILLEYIYFFQIYICQIDIIQIFDDNLSNSEKKIEDAKKVIKNKKSIVFFLASWCGHCKVLKETLIPLLNNLKTTSLNGAIVLVDNEKLHVKLPYGDSIQGYPTIKMMDVKNNNV